MTIAPPPPVTHTNALVSRKKTDCPVFAWRHFCMFPNGCLFPDLFASPRPPSTWQSRLRRAVWRRGSRNQFWSTRRWSRSVVRRSGRRRSCPSRARRPTGLQVAGMAKPKSWKRSRRIEEKSESWRLQQNSKKKCEKKFLFKPYPPQLMIIKTIYYFWKFWLFKFRKFWKQLINLFHVAQVDHKIYN